MRTAGLLGGMSWESTLEYYRAINAGVMQALGGLHSAPLVLHSFDFHEIERLQHAGDWDRLAECLSLAARNLEGAGADFLLICTNTMHKVAPAVEAAVSIPLLHIADATAAVLRADGAETVGLLGTAFTMEQDFYRGRLSHHHGYPVLVPGPEDRQTVHRVIYEELCKENSFPAPGNVSWKSSKSWPIGGRKQSSSGAPRSDSWSARTIPQSHSSIRPGSTRSRP
jgi:aspartate racemase